MMMIFKWEGAADQVLGVCRQLSGPVEGCRSDPLAVCHGRLKRKVCTQTTRVRIIYGVLTYPRPLQLTDRPRGASSATRIWWWQADWSVGRLATKTRWRQDT